MPPFDLAETDRLLTTTRSVRKRLDFDRPVERAMLLDCVRVAQQAPTAGNVERVRWLFVTDPATRSRLGDLYRRASSGYLWPSGTGATLDAGAARILDSARYLAENLEAAPVLAIPCIRDRLPSEAVFPMASAVLGSAFPAVWSFQLALRARGLGSCLTSFHLEYESETAEMLDIPSHVQQLALIPVAHTKGTDFKRAKRPDPEAVVHWDTWTT